MARKGVVAAVDWREPGEGRCKPGEVEDDELQTMFDVRTEILQVDNHRAGICLMPSQPSRAKCKNATTIPIESYLATICSQASSGLELHRSLKKRRVKS